MSAAPVTQLILASQSPRRRQMLAALGLQFRTRVPQVDETRLPDETVEAYAPRVAEAKARAVAATLGDRDTPFAIISADTVVTLGETLLGKPLDTTEARAMLSRLSGRTHAVLSGLCLWIAHPGAPPRIRSALERTTVTFKRLLPAEIEAYVNTPEPYDKAGAYAIQGGAAYFVARLDGSYTNVVGLPLTRLVEWLEAEDLWPPESLTT
ncbi:MAG: Maf family protein [Candidatus Marinimicrobia bacterium]|nr:Maf family protein [Candidatus Neomarinimicrobiota bacterium]